MIREYPVQKLSSTPSTGSLFYEFLLRNVKIPASSNHNIWYAGEEKKLSLPEKYAFRGDIPVGKTLELVTLSGKEINSPHTFNGDEEHVLVSDLSENAKLELRIPTNARGKDKVFNSNFRKYDDLPELTKVSNELACLSVPKSISSYLSGVKGKINYSEKDVYKFLSASFDDLSSSEMMHILHGNHMAWTALAYIRSKGNVEGDILSQFHSQNTTDYYVKDLGTVLPAMFFALASLGKNPVEFYNKIDVEIWGAKDAAEYMQKFLP